MEAVLYYLVYGLTWILSLLPLRIMYIVSDFIYLLLYYFPSYRRKITAENLKNSFPEKNEKELKCIEKKFYHHLADLFIEDFKLIHMSSAQLEKRCVFTNTEIIHKLFDENRDVAAIMGHYGNWEWLVTLPMHSKYKFISIYKPIQNKLFDRFMNNVRTRYGMHTTPMSHIIKQIINDRNNNIRTFSSFISDQSPVKEDIKYRMPFLNQDTPVYLGAEKIALKYDMAVVFINVQKVKRGYYTATIELLFDHTKGLPEHLITETHVKRLEEIIREKPEYWLWSHRRWKHKRQVENE
ncbi:MAG: lysophospholipid acyltransferase family protein [Bacteroidales bacterium]|nr:lysophospholipid acyltransferase family protein [Bacteroidales bacterium]